MAKLRATGLLVAGPVGPEAPELPDVATGLLTAFEDDEPVLPELVALAWELAAPELPVAAEGLALTEVVPPMPPLALPTETEEPPIAVARPVGATTMFRAGPPGPATGTTTPPGPPLPPAPTRNSPLMELPVRP